MQLRTQSNRISSQEFMRKIHTPAFFALIGIMVCFFVCSQIMMRHRSKTILPTQHRMPSFHRGVSFPLTWDVFFVSNCPYILYYANFPKCHNQLEMKRLGLAIREDWLKNERTNESRIRNTTADTIEKAVPVKL